MDPNHILLRDRPLLSSLLQLLNQLKSKVSTQPNKLKWGYRLAGNFTLKEDYHLVAHHSDLPVEDIWKKIWKRKLWPKVAHKEPFFGRLLIRRFSHGITYVSEAFKACDFVFYAIKVVNQWNINSTPALSTNHSRNKEP
jgi:hypothetical protein